MFELDDRPEHITLENLTPLGQAALAYIEEVFPAVEATGHDLFHVKRVTRTAQRLAAAISGHSDTPIDYEALEVIALLHDLDDFKFTGDELAGSRAALAWLESHGVDSERAAYIARNIAGISYKGAHTPQTALDIEGQIVQDADRLDALGPVGILRCGAYGGRMGRPICDPGIEAFLAATAEQYLRHQGTSVGHFDEKLLRLIDLFNTDAAKQIAQPLHAYTVDFIERFARQWNGTDWPDLIGADTGSV